VPPDAELAVPAALPRLSSLPQAVNVPAPIEVANASTASVLPSLSRLTDLAF